MIRPDWVAHRDVAREAFAIAKFSPVLERRCKVFLRRRERVSRVPPQVLNAEQTLTH